MLFVNNCVFFVVELQFFGVEFDVLCVCQLVMLGVVDVCYICCVVVGVCWIGVVGCVLLFLGVFVYSVLILVWIVGVVLLVLFKILENMELVYNVIYGQYDWMGDLQLQGSIYEWDIVGIVDNWCKIYNFCYYIYINVCGFDDDIGYGLLCIFFEQCWCLFFLFQLVVVVVFVLLFEWGIVIQDL